MYSFRSKLVCLAKLVCDMKIRRHYNLLQSLLIFHKLLIRNHNRNHYCPMESIAAIISVIIQAPGLNVVTKPLDLFSTSAQIRAESFSSTRLFAEAAFYQTYSKVHHHSLNDPMCRFRELPDAIHFWACSPNA